MMRSSSRIRGESTACLVLLASILIKCSTGSVMANNSTDDLLARHKRTLIYNINGGIAKFVMGLLVPVDLTGKRSLNWAVNLQAQYTALDRIDYNPWGLTRSFGTTKNQQRSDEPDYSREFFYGVIETIMNRYGKNGRACLERAICEASQHPMSGGAGLFGELANAIFIPTQTIGVETSYYSAHLAGAAGVDCLKQFPECPREDGILERFSFLA